MHELRPGLWHWQAPHPDWQAGAPWPQEVSSYAIDDGEHLVLFDPLAVPKEIEELAADREPVVVLTAPWHERDAQSLVERLGVPVFAPPPDTQEDLMQKFGVTAEQAVGGSPDLAWLFAGDGGEAHAYLAGDRLPKRALDLADGQFPKNANREPATVPRTGTIGEPGDFSFAGWLMPPAPCKSRPATRVLTDASGA